MFIAILFYASAEGVSGRLMFGENFELLKSRVEEEVDSANRGDYTCEWEDENTFYPVGEDLDYSGFNWAKIYPATEYVPVDFSEYAGS